MLIITNCGLWPTKKGCYLGKNTGNLIIIITSPAIGWGDSPITYASYDYIRQV